MEQVANKQPEDSRTSSRNSGTELSSEIREENDRTDSSDRRLRRYFSDFDRLSPTLTRFFSRFLPFSGRAELERVERITPVTSRQSDKTDDLKSLFPVGRIDASAEKSFWTVFDWPLLWAILDRLLGSPDYHPDFRKTLTPVDQKLAALFQSRLAELLGGFWNEGVPFTSEPLTVGTIVADDSFFFSPNDSFPRDSSSGETNSQPLFLVRWAIRSRDDEFSFSLLIPESVLTHLFSSRLEKSSPSFSPPSFSTSRRGEKIERESAVLSQRENAPEEKKNESWASEEIDKRGKSRENREVEIRVLAGELEMTPESARLLEVGDLLTTDIPAGEPFSIWLDGTPVFYGRPGEFRDNVAVEILDR